MLAVGCDKATTLLRLADLAIEIPEGRESSATQTRSFAGMFVAAQAIVSQLASRHASASPLHAALEALPSLGTDYIDRARETVSYLAADAGIERIFVLGSGTRFTVSRAKQRSNFKKCRSRWPRRFIRSSFATDRCRW